jgi:hypothetical protein
MGRGGTPGTLALGDVMHGREGRSGHSGWLRGAVISGLACALVALACAAALQSPGRAGERAIPAALGLGSLPLAAQGVVSATLGGADAGYRLRGLQALTPAQRLRSDFSRRGVTVVSGSGRVSLSLSSYGFEHALRRLAPTTPRVSANRVYYSHGALSEWFVNGPLGLEQGFDVAARPGAGSGPLTFSLTVGGNLRPSVVRRSLLLARRGAAMRYDGLLVTDARGRVLRSWLALRDGHLLIRVDDRGAVYPVRVDPLIQQGEALSGGGGIGASAFGRSVALSANGDTALVGGPVDDGGVGAVWVFTRSGSTWTQGPKLTGGGESGEGSFGSSVALAAEGSIALIGAPLDDNDTGAVWVFKRSGSTWTQQGPKLTGPGESGVIFFGKSVALSSNGEVALIGGQVNNSDAGGAWVLTRSGSGWRRRVSKLAGRGATGQGRFGSSVALSADGRTALVGGYANNSVGGAWVFTRSHATWRQQGPELTANGQSTASSFGFSLALSDTGNTALIGGPGEASAGGGAWVFTRSGSSWTQRGPMLGGEQSAGSRFGNSVALSGNGNIALVGDPGGSADTGAALEFARANSKWTQEGSQLVGSGASAGAAFGLSVALAGNGATALIGGVAPLRLAGEAWVFVGPESTEPETPTSSAPVISQPRQTVASWREGHARPLITADLGHVAPIGTTFSFALNVPASVTMTFSMRAKCLARTGTKAAGHGCAHTLTFAAHAGANKVRFDGVISKHVKLSPGSYTLLIAASASGERSTPRALHFKIV